jgi:hypothetical protein
MEYNNKEGLIEGHYVHCSEYVKNSRARRVRGSSTERLVTLE